MYGHKTLPIVSRHTLVSYINVPGNMVRHKKLLKAPKRLISLILIFLDTLYMTCECRTQWRLSCWAAREGSKGKAGREGRIGWRIARWRVNTGWLPTPACLVDAQAWTDSEWRVILGLPELSGLSSLQSCDDRHGVPWLPLLPPLLLQCSLQWGLLQPCVQLQAQPPHSHQM